jgi:hypothetical protein
MSTEDEEKRMNDIRDAMEAHLQDAAGLALQLPPDDHLFWLADAIAAWEVKADEGISGDMITAMVEQLYRQEELAGTVLKKVAHDDPASPRDTKS